MGHRLEIKEGCPGGGWLAFYEYRGAGCQPSRIAPGAMLDVSGKSYISMVER